MILLLDIGNSTLNWGWLSDGEIVNSSWADHDGGFSEKTLEGIDTVEPAERVLCVNVAGKQAHDLVESWSRSEHGVECEFVVSEKRNHGVTNAYDNPDELGDDRWAAMIGAWSMFGGPVCVVDAGTALTVDAIDENGRHLGGVITPGLTLMQDSLLDRTAGINKAHGSASEPFASGTAAGVRSGAQFALAALIERQAHALETLSDAVPLIVMTGGDAPVLAEYVHGQVELVPDLVLRGLAVAAKA